MFGVLNLVIGICLLFGAWNLVLEFHTVSFSRIDQKARSRGVENGYST
jgi:hypothetical protein